jgi:trehalose-6-phosphatase
MGADGHVKVYNMNIFMEKYGVAKTEEFIKTINDSQCYSHDLTIKGCGVIPVLTVYKGDNISDESLFDKINYGCDELNEYDIKRINEHSFTVEELTYMISFLNSDCAMGWWEVWT